MFSGILRHDTVRTGQPVGHGADYKPPHLLQHKHGIAHPMPKKLFTPPLQTEKTHRVILALACPPDTTLADVSGCYLGLLRVSRRQLWGKGKQLEPVGWRRLWPHRAVERKQIKQSLPFPAVTQVMGLQGRQKSCWRSKETECQSWGRSLWLWFSMAEGSRNGLNKSLSRKTYTESILPWGT